MSNFRKLVHIIFCFLVCNSVFAQWQQPDTLVLQLDDCSGEVEWCVDIPLNDIDNYVITKDEVSLIENLEGCKADTFIAMTYFNTFGQGQLGPYHLDSWMVDGQSFSGEFMDITALVDSMNIWDPSGMWVDYPEEFIIKGGNPSSSYSDMTITVLAINLPSVIVANLSPSTPTGTALMFEQGVYQIEIREILSGMAQTTTVVVACPQDIELDTNLDINTSTTECFTADNFGLQGSIASIENTCPMSTMNVEFVLQENCVTATANAVSNESACYLICDEYDVCTNFNWNITVIGDESYNQEITYTLPIYNEGSHCFDLSQLNGDITNIVELCNDQNGENVFFEQLDEQTNCISFNTIDIGSDTICFNFTDSNADMLTSSIIVNVTPPAVEWVDLILTEGETIEVCPNLDELSANIVNFYDDCQNNEENTVNLTINDVSLCLDIEAISVGQDTACIILCDENNICDTTYYIINVTTQENLPPPIATDDNAETPHNSSVVINICDNDVIPNNSLMDYYLVPESEGGITPSYGIATMNNDCTLTYLPQTSECDVTDTLVYEICNATGCTQAVVTIYISCYTVSEGELKFYSGFSPNNDNINDSFVIEGVENYPNSTLFVYNRWGNEVFRQEAYKNTWQGDFNGQILPDGTYFYVFWDGLGHIMSGYIQLQR